MTTTAKIATAAVESPMAAASTYQQLRAHLAELKLHDAAEALPAVLDQATAEGLSVTTALERHATAATIPSAPEPHPGPNPATPK